MAAKPTLVRNSARTTVVAVTLAAAITIATMSALVARMTVSGTPFDALVAAERACSAHAYVSDRDGCVQAWLAARREVQLAAR